MDWQAYSFVVRSKQRERVILALGKPKTPTQLGSELDINVSHISRTLREFMKQKLVECVTPKEKVGRLYKLTRDGEKIRIELKK